MGNPILRKTYCAGPVSHSSLCGRGRTPRSQACSLTREREKKIRKASLLPPLRATLAQTHTTTHLVCLREYAHRSARAGGWNAKQVCECRQNRTPTSRAVAPDHPTAQHALVKTLGAASRDGPQIMVDCQARWGIGPDLLRLSIALAPINCWKGGDPGQDSIYMVSICGRVRGSTHQTTKGCQNADIENIRRHWTNCNHYAKTCRNSLLVGTISLKVPLAVAEGAR